jgi:hypothetical protein
MCIDQSNVDKHNRQVGFMSKIYEQCLYTTTWLGFSDALRTAATTLKAFLEQPTLDRVPFDALLSLLNITYLTRLWVGGFSQNGERRCTLTPSDRPRGVAVSRRPPTVRRSVAIVSRCVHLCKDPRRLGC